jgi:hypothetical protein
MNMDASSLISGTSGVAEDGFDEHLAEEVPPHFVELIKIAMEHLGDEIAFSFAHPQLGVKGRIAGEGLNLAVKNAAKFVKK